MPDEDPGKVRKPEDRPLTGKKSFVNSTATTVFGKQERKTIFTGGFAMYEYEYEPDFSKAGCWDGPGPASINVRELSS